MLRTSPDWEYVAWLRRNWDGPFVVKGVLRAQDAKRLEEAGADAVWISNHGGRQFDGCPAAIEVLPEIREAVQIPLIFDSGIEGGLDIIRALALGADFVMLGRACHYALAALGADGPAHLTGILAKDMGIKPDLMTFAKQLSSAYFPISASVIPGWMYEAMIAQTNEVGVFGHGYTYSGHPAACAAALKTLEIYERDNLFEHAAEVGAYMQVQLREIFTDHPLVGEVRGKGLIAALELVSNKTTGASFDKGAAGAAAQKACQENGLILRAVAGNALALCPPLIITKAEVDDMLARMKTAVDTAYAELQDKGLIAA